MSINMTRFDLNLLRLFLIVFDTSSVSEAADRLGLSQPAASSALNRLREKLDDPLFVRGKGGMVPTPYATGIADNVRASLTALEDALVHPQHFDPKTTDHVLRLSLSGLGETLLLPAIARQILKAAPAVRFQNLSVAKDKVADALQRGEIDLAIGMLDIRQRGVEVVDLFQETYSAIASRDRFQDRPIDLKTTKLVLAAPESTYATDIERWVTDKKLAGNVTMRLRHFGGLSDLLGDIDAVAIVPTQYADRLAVSENIREVARITELGNAWVRMIWHKRTANEPTARWIRGQIKTLFAGRA